MAIPSQILKQAEEAEKLFKEQTAPVEPPPVAEGQPAVPDQPPAEDQPPVEPPVEPPPDESPPKQSEETFEQKYSVLKGKYDAEVPILAKQLTQASNEISNLRSEILTIKSQVVTQPVEAPATKPKSFLEAIEANPDVEYVKTEYPHVWKGMATALEAAAKNAQEEVGKLSQEINARKERDARNDRDKFYDTLDSKVPDWSVVQLLPEFNQWLMGKDRYTSLPKRVLMEDAFKSFDGDRITAFFEDFKGSQAPLEGPPATPPVKDKTIIAPPRSAGTKTPAAAGRGAVEYIKSSDIDRFYKDQSRGVYRGREKEVSDIEAQIEKATSEGRVVQG